MRRLLPALLLYNFLHNGKPRVFRRLQHLELLLGQLIDSTFHTVAFEGAGEFGATKDILFTHKRATTEYRKLQIVGKIFDFWEATSQDVTPLHSLVVETLCTAAI